MPNRRITAVKRPRIRFHKWQCITGRLKACKILNYTYRYVKAVPFGNKRCTKGVPSCQFFFFFFLVQAVGPWYGASATKPFWVPSRGSVQAYNEFKNIRDVLWVEILLIILLIYAIWKLSYSIGLWSSTEEGGGYSFSGLAFWKPVFCNWLENVYDIRRQGMSFYFTPVWSYI